MLEERWRSITDLLLPTASRRQKARGEVDKPIQDALDALVTDRDVVKARFRVRREIEREAERRSGVEARLSGILGQATLSSGIMLGAAAFILSDNIEKYLPSTVIPVLVLAFLSSANVVWAARSAVKGLDRRVYLQASLSDILAVHEPPRARLQDDIRRLRNHQEQTNEKITQMAIGYRAMRNALVYLLLGGLLCFAFRAVDLSFRPKSHVAKDGSHITRRGSEGTR